MRNKKMSKHLHTTVVTPGAVASNNREDNDGSTKEATWHDLS
jgi:hypothetical protein